MSASVIGRALGGMAITGTRYPVPIAATENGPGTTCRQCGVRFRGTEDWAYRRGGYRFCTWGCLRAYERTHASKSSLYRGYAWAGSREGCLHRIELEQRGLERAMERLAMAKTPASRASADRARLLYLERLREAEAFLQMYEEESK